MAETNEKIAVETVATGTAKKKRRGISNETRATSNLKFTEKDATQQGLFIGIVDDVKVNYATFGEEVSIASFAGKAVPRLSIHFTSAHASIPERRHVYLEFNPVESNVSTIPGGNEEWKVNRVFQYIKHVLDVFYLKGRELTEKEEDALTLPFEDYDEEGNYTPIEPDDVLNGYKIVFENVVAMLKGTWSGDGEATNKPCYLDEKGTPKRVFMKLLRYIKQKGKGWKAVGQNGDLAFPGFVGQGVLELVKKTDVPASILSINVITESITPKQTESQAPSLPNNLPAGMAGGIPVGGAGGFDNQTNSAFAAAGDDMPF